MRTIRFGIIGGGLMGKEFASAAARWSHLVDPPARPEIVALASAGGLRTREVPGKLGNRFPTLSSHMSRSLRSPLQRDPLASGSEPAPPRTK